MSKIHHAQTDSSKSSFESLDHRTDPSDRHAEIFIDEHGGTGFSNRADAANELNSLTLGGVHMRVDQAKYWKDIRSKRQHFIESLRLLKHFGYHFRDSKTVMPHNLEFLSLTGQTDEQKVVGRLLKKHGYSYILTEEGILTALLYRQDNFYPDIALLPDVRKYELSSFFRNEQKTSDEPRDISYLTVHFVYEREKRIFKIIIWNWFQEEPVYFGVYGLRNKKELRSLIPEMKKCLKEHFENFDFEKTIKDLPDLSDEEVATIHDNEVYAVNHEGVDPDDDRQKTWDDLLNDFDVSIYAAPDKSNIDRNSEAASRFYNPTHIELSRDSAVNMSSFAINGRLDGMIFTLRDKQRGIQAYKKVEDIEAPVKDAYGNYIFADVATSKGPENPFIKSFVIYSPYIFSNSGEEFVPLNVDLSAFGLGVYLNVAAQKTIQRNRFDNGFVYNACSQLSDENSDKEKEIFEKSAKAISFMETEFGLKQGAVVKNILITPSLHENAMVRVTNSDTVIIWDEMMDRILKPDGEFVVRHEALHALDLHFGISDYPAFQELFKLYQNVPVGRYFNGDSQKNMRTSSQMMFNTINESYFLGTGMGGHSSDDEKEFFASLVHTLYASDWLGKVTEMEAPVRNYYYNALKVLQKALHTTVPEIASSEIDKKLNFAIQSLQDTYDDLLPLSAITDPVSAIDVLQKNGIHLLNSTDELNVLKNGDKPVAVLTDLDNDPDMATIFVELKKRYGADIEFVAQKDSSVDLFPNKKIYFRARMCIYIFKGTQLSEIQVLGNYRDQYLNDIEKQEQPYDANDAQNFILNQASAWYNRWIYLHGHMELGDLPF